MTREELTSLAALHGVEIFPSMAPRDAVLVAFELGAKIEREECAKVCDAAANDPNEWAYERAMAVRCSKAIRARSENA